MCCASNRWQARGRRGEAKTVHEQTMASVKFAALAIVLFQCLSIKLLHRSTGVFRDSLRRGIVDALPPSAQGGARHQVLGSEAQIVRTDQRKLRLCEMVEPMGFEPTTSSMPSRRAPNCATAPPKERNGKRLYSIRRRRASNRARS